MTRYETAHELPLVPLNLILALNSDRVLPKFALKFALSTLTKLLKSVTQKHIMK